MKQENNKKVLPENARGVPPAPYPICGVSCSGGGGGLVPFPGLSGGGGSDPYPDPGGYPVLFLDRYHMQFLLVYSGFLSTAHIIMIFFTEICSRYSKNT